MGIRIRIPKADAISYHAARARDPDFTTICRDYTHLAAYYREIAVLEQEMAGLYRAAQGIWRKLAMVQEEYKRIWAEETGPGGLE